MDYSACSSEPIHTPGSIQPHGILLVLASGSERIVAAAGDLAALLDFPGDPVGHLYKDLVGAPFGDMAQAAGLTLGGEPLFLGTVHPGAGFHELDILAHQRGGSILVEFEPSLQDRPSAARLLARLRPWVARIKGTAGIDAACREAAEAVRAFTGFDRVMVYRFLENGSGKVVAQAGTDALESLLDHHFPESDIPAQARALYRRNPVRAIPDVGYRPAPLRPETAAALDMSDCALRSVSPVHVQYLQNMGVASSMSVSIVLGERLWGLIACHGTRPITVPYELREACKLVAAGLTQQIETVEAQQRAAEAERLAHRREILLAHLAEVDAADAEIKRRLPAVLSLLPASGIVVSQHGAVFTYGLTPSQADSLALCAWTRRRDSITPFSTDALAAVYPPAAAFAEQASGVLAITAGVEDPLEILWLRPEFTETVDWAGNPHKDADEGASPAPLTPRHSFATWRETVRGRARPWTQPEIDAVQRLRDGIERILERQRLNSLQAEVIHMSRVNAMGTMASAIAHELNQPLTSVHSYAVGLARMLAGRDDLDPEITEVLARISEQALRAGDIVRHLRELVARGKASLRPVPLLPLVESACALSLLDAPRIRVASHIAVAADLTVLADGVQVQQVLMNLVRNALDAMASLAPGKPRRLAVAAARLPGGFVQLGVEDSGEGLADAVRDKLFSAFNSSKQDGLGIGLSICRTIIEAHGGRIWAESLEGGGTAFCFTLQEAPGA